MCVRAEALHLRRSSELGGGDGGGRRRAGSGVEVLGSTVHRSWIARRGTYGTTATRFLSFRICASERYELSPLILAGSWSGLPESGRSRKVFVFAWLCGKTQHFLGQLTCGVYESMVHVTDKWDMSGIYFPDMPTVLR